uniref:Uncharacterized protein n=1 Tax=Clytia hemisphaerica TaxID=252671 RepID=A0A7M5V5D2_9CNID
LQKNIKIKNIKKIAMIDDKKSWFIPPDFKAKDIQPLFIGFEPFDKDEMGFYHTGEYFLAKEDPKISDTVRIHIIEFCKSFSKFLQRIVTVKLRSCVGYYNYEQLCFYPDVGFLLHTIERYSSDREYFTIDLYGYHIINWFEKNRNNIELCMDLKPSPDLSLTYASEFRFLSYHYYNIIGNIKRLIISAFSQRTVDEANGPSPVLYQSLCLDFLNIELHQIKREKRLVIELDRPLENSFVFMIFY